MADRSSDMELPDSGEHSTLLESPLTEEQTARLLEIVTTSQDRAHLLAALRRYQARTWSYATERVVGAVIAPNKENAGGYKVSSSADAATRALKVVMAYSHAVDQLVRVLEGVK